jgi:hypothetical protein
VGKTVEISLKNTDEKVIVDSEDYEKVKDFKWSKDNNGYAASSLYVGNGKSKFVNMHRLILGEIKEGLRVDHINLNKLDNRKSNLRLATASQNAWNTGLRSTNTSGYKGVSRKGRNWISIICVNGVKHTLGTYESKEDAAKAYNIMAIKYFGEFAHLNDVDHTGFRLKPKQQKTSNYLGVFLDKQSNKWIATIRINGKQTNLGRFETEHDAARMYNFWEKDIHGESAKLNVIKGETK